MNATIPDRPTFPVSSGQREIIIERGTLTRAQLDARAKDER